MVLFLFRFFFVCVRFDTSRIDSFFFFWFDFCERKQSRTPEEKVNILKVRKKRTRRTQKREKRAKKKLYLVCIVTYYRVNKQTNKPT